MRNHTCSILTAVALTAAVLAVPSRADACRLLDRLFGWCSPSHTTYYAPVTTYSVPTVAPSCSSCVAPSDGCATCYYTPQTSYRVAYSPVATVAYRPSLIPYRSYRMVYSPVVTPAAVCDPCAGGACGTTAYYGGTVVSDVSSCASCVPTASYMISSDAAPAPGSTQSAPANGSGSAQTYRSQKPTDSRDENGGSNGNGQLSPYNGNGAPQPQRSLRPVPDDNTRFEQSTSPENWVRQTSYRAPSHTPTGPKTVDIQWRAASR